MKDFYRELIYDNCFIFKIPTYSSDSNKIVLTVNHKESGTVDRIGGANGSKKSIKSNKVSGNSSYITQNTKSNGSPEKVSCM